MGIVQMQAIQEAATAQARARALIGMSPCPNIIVIFSPLAAYIGL